MTNIVPDLDDAYILFFSSEDVVMSSRDFDPKFELLGGIEVKIFLPQDDDVPEDEPFEMSFVLAKNEYDTLGPSFDEDDVLPEYRFSSYVIEKIRYSRRIADMKFELNLSNVILHIHGKGSAEELEHPISQWLTFFIAKYFKFTVTIGRSDNHPNTIIARVCAIFLPQDESKSFAFIFRLDDLKENGLTEETIDEYFGLMPK